MSANASQIVQKLWSYCNVLRDDGLSYQDYLEQLTFLLFLKMADERVKTHREEQPIPEGYRWEDLTRREGVALEAHYRDTLKALGRAGGMLGVIFEKAQNKIQDPAKLRQLIVELIGKEQWGSMSADVKGDAYEGLLEKNASDVKGGAGQYFTPRSLIQAMVECARPKPGEIISDPASGTGGFLLAAHDYIAKNNRLDRDEKKHLRFEAIRGVELVPGVARLCAMNLFLRGVGPYGNECEAHGKAEFCPEGKDSEGKPLPRPCKPFKPPITTDDALRSEPSYQVDVVLANPPFGKKSSITVVNEKGEADQQGLTYNRQDFWTTTSNKQLNFVQHIKSLLKIHGRAAVVVPDNVLFEGGAGETVRRRLLHECEVHTLLRLPTGIFYAQGVKANVLFFDRKPGAKDPWTKTVWVYDLRTNQRFTLKQRPLTRADLDEFVACYQPEDRHRRAATWSEAHPEGRWRPYTYEEIIHRDKVSLDLFWLRDESLEDSANLPDPHLLAQEIADDLQSALEQIQDILGDLEARAARVEALRAAAPAEDEEGFEEEDEDPEEDDEGFEDEDEDPEEDDEGFEEEDEDPEEDDEGFEEGDEDPEEDDEGLEEGDEAGEAPSPSAVQTDFFAAFEHASSEELLGVILGHLEAHPQAQFSKGDLLEQLEGFPEHGWLAVSKLLADHPQVSRTGRARGTRYQWAGVEL